MHLLTFLVAVPVPYVSSRTEGKEHRCAHLVVPQPPHCLNRALGSLHQEHRYSAHPSVSTVSTGLCRRSGYAVFPALLLSCDWSSMLKRLSHFPREASLCAGHSATRLEENPSSSYLLIRSAHSLAPWRRRSMMYSRARLAGLRR